MRTIIFAALALSTVATPAFADSSDNFVGPRAELMIGYENIKENSYPTNEDGLAFAGAVGYDIRMSNNTMAGIDLEMGDSGSSKLVTPTVRWDTGRTLYAGGRVGVAIDPKAQLYVKAGYANSEVRLVNNPGGTTFYTGEVEGVRIGAGGEYLVNDKVFVKGEYRYTNQEDSVSSHQAMAGVGVRF